MKALLLMAILLVWNTLPARALTPVMIQDFEKPSPAPAVWVVNIPNDHASAQFSTEHPQQGRGSLKLHYHFTGDKPGQYLGVPVPIRIQAPIHKLSWMLFGDASNLGCALYLADSSGETHKFRDPNALKISWKGWKEMAVDVDAPHETWGGDKNGKINYLLTGLAFEISHDGTAPIESELFFDKAMLECNYQAQTFKAPTTQNLFYVQNFAFFGARPCVVRVRSSTFACLLPEQIQPTRAP